MRIMCLPVSRHCKGRLAFTLIELLVVAVGSFTSGWVLFYKIPIEQ